MACVALTQLVAVGCEAKPYVKEDRTDYRLRRPDITHAVPGAYRACVGLDDGLIVTAQGGNVMVIDPKTCEQRSTIEVSQVGKTGEVTDLATDGTTVWACVGRDRVVQLGVTPGSDALEILATKSTEELGLKPHTVVLVGGRVIICGSNGAIDAASGRRFGPDRGPVDAAVVVGGREATVVAGRLRSDRGTVAPATSVVATRDGLGRKGGAIVAIQEADGARIVMIEPSGESVAELTIPGSLERMRIIGSRLYLITPGAVHSWGIGKASFMDPEHFAVKGALDVCPAEMGDLFICGTFGRALYHPHSDGRGPGDTFFAVTRAPGRLEVARGDGRRIRAGSAEGVWDYRTGADAEITSRKLPPDADRPIEAKGPWGLATVTREDGDDRVTVQRDGVTLAEYTYPVVSEVQAESDALWIAHGQGIDIYKAGPAGTLELVASFTFASPVIHLFAENTGGMGYVTLFSGMGTIDWIPYGEPILPPGAKPSPATHAP